jgi:iron complex transport system substrate-binding protein
MKSSEAHPGNILPHPSLEKTLSSILLLFTLAACDPQEAKDREREEGPSRKATRFELLDRPYGHLLHILDKKGRIRESFQLVEEGKEAPDSSSKKNRIQVPVRRIACLSAPHAGMLLELNASQHIKAFPSKSYLYDRGLRERMEQGSIESIGMQRSLDTERLIALELDLLLDDGMSGRSGEGEGTLERAGTPTLDILDWKEEHPLGRLEWIRVFGALTGKEALADSIFRQRSRVYDSLRTEAADAKENPKILCNAPHKGTWHIPGGNSYMARLIRDAGAAHPWPKNESTGGVPKSLEEVIANARNAEFWIDPGGVNSLEELSAMDERIDRFKAYRQKAVFKNDARSRPDGGNDFWESGPLHPEKVLEDLIRIFHPDEDRGQELYYYRKLPESTGS